MEGIRLKIGELRAKNSVSHARDVFNEISRRQWLFSAVIVLASIFTWLSLYLALYQVYSGFTVWIASVFFVFLLSVIVALSFFAINSMYLVILSYLLVSLSAFLFFGWRGYEVLGVLVLFIALVFGYFRVKHEKSLLVKFLYIRIIRKGLPIFFTGLAVSLAIFYNASPMGKVFERPQIPKVFFDVVLLPVEYVLTPALPGFDIGMEIGDVERLTSRELPSFFDVPPAVVSGVVQDFFSRVPDEVRGETITQFITDLVNAQLDAILLPYKQFLPVVFLFGLFLVFKAMGIPLMWLSIGTNWLVIKMLLRFNVIQIIKVETEKEELVL